MRRGAGMIGIATVLMGLAIGGAALASSSNGKSQGASERGRTFALLDFQTSFVPVNGSTPKPGNLFLVHSVLKTHAGTKAGVLDGKCTDLSTGSKGVFHCEGTTTFTDGATIEFAGLGKVVSLDFTVAVTGGTGRYSGAKGQLSFHSLNADGSRNLDTFKLAG